jgi:prepilin-type N-terminal cleavage/methylation domain-containing protein
MHNTLKRKNRGFSLIELSIVVLIIGILIAGVTQGSRLVRQSLIKTAQSQTSGSPVAGITGLALWVETTSDSSFTDQLDDSTPIANWYDINPGATNKINLGYDVVNGITTKPLYIANGINSLPIIRFDGVNDCLITPSTSPVSSSALTQNGKITIFVVAKYYGPNTTGVFLKSQNAGSTFRVGLEMNGNFSRFDFLGDSLLSVTTNIASKNHIFLFYKNTTTQSIFLDGSATAEATNANAVNSYILGNYNLSIGADSDPAVTPNACNAYYSQIDIGEVIIFDHALKSDERQYVTNYLSKKWGIALKP